MNFKAVLVLGVSSAAAICCGGKRPGPGPTPLPNAPTLSCPADITLASHQGQPQPTANFDAPVATDGQPPVNVTCNPGSGNEFPNGTTVVTCEAVDAAARKGSCTFAVIVTPVPLLTKTKFLAFGDSLTEGKPATLTFRGVIVLPPRTPPVFNTPFSYVSQLNEKLTVRYQDQTVTIIADGWGGEKAGEGKLRLERDWPAYNPDALFVMEGVNDLLSPDTFTPAGMQLAINSVIDALRRMIRFAQGRGARVFVGTLPPMNAPKPENVIAAIPVLNDRIRALVVQEGAILADLNAAVPSNLIGRDGLHPTEEGYGAIADEWLKAIIETMEIKPSTVR